MIFYFQKNPNLLDFFIHIVLAGAIDIQLFAYSTLHTSYLILDLDTINEMY